MTPRARGRWAIIITLVAMVLFALIGWSGTAIALAGLIVFIGIDKLLEMTTDPKRSRSG